MNPLARLATVAVLAAIAIGGSLYALGGSNGGIGGQPTPSPTAAPASAAPTRLMAGPLPMGTYVGPTLQVSDIVARVNADASLTPADRTEIIDVLMAIRDKTTWTVSIELREGQMTERQTVDGVTVIGSSGRYSFPDDRTLVYTEGVSETEVGTRFELTVDGDSFTLNRTTPGHGAADEFVVNTIFESGPFTLR